MMKSKSMLVTTLLASAVAWPSLVYAQQVIESEVAGAPSFVIPDIAEMEPDRNEEPSDPMLETIRREIAEKYAGEEPVDGARLGALIDGTYLQDYKLDELGDPVHFSNSIFDVTNRPAPPEPEAQPEPPKADPADAFALFLSTPDGIRALSSMNGDQIEAIAMMMEMMRNPGAAPVQPSRQAAQDALMGGIPALGTSDLNKMEPEDLIRMAMETVKPREVNLGDGRDIYLSSWKAGSGEGGEFHLVNDHLPGSQITVMIGDVVGEFGRIVSAEIDPHRGALVVFQSGDVIAEREEPNLNDGIPMLGQSGSFPGDTLSGEIIVSTPATLGSGDGNDAKTRGPALGLSTATKYAPERAERPVTRSASLGQQ